MLVFKKSKPIFIVLSASSIVYIRKHEIKSFFGRCQITVIAK